MSTMRTIGIVAATAALAAGLSAVTVHAIDPVSVSSRTWDCTRDGDATCAVSDPDTGVRYAVVFDEHGQPIEAYPLGLPAGR